MSRAARLLFALALAACSDGAPPLADLAVADLARGDLARGEAPPDGGRRGDAAPDAAQVDPSRPLWLVQVSDLHFGGSSEVDKRLALLLDEVLPAVKPALTANTGDTVEEGGKSSWTPYASIVSAKAPAYPGYLEIPGNHDIKNDGAPGLLANSVTGKAGAGLHGETIVGTPAGKLRVLRTNTADSSSLPVILAGYFGEKQKNELLALPAPTPPPVHSVVLGHHPVVGLISLQPLGTDGNMRQLLDHVGAGLYLCGHVHVPAISWIKKTLVVQASSLGKSNPPSFMIAALDPSGPSVREVLVEGGAKPRVSWPLVLITSPPDAALGGGNPWAAAASASAPLEVRALAFAPAAVQSVEARWDMGSWQPLAAAGGGLWSGKLALGKQGKGAVEVRATSSQGTASHAVQISVGP